MSDLNKLGRFLGITKQRETELWFKKALTRIQSLEFYIDSLLKGQGIHYVYIVIDLRVSKEIFQTVNNALKKSKYKNRIRYCFEVRIYFHSDQSSLYIVLFKNQRLLHFLYLNKRMFLSLEDLCVAWDRDDLLRIEIPPIFNSIENSFQNIGIYYTHSFGKKIFSYLQSNPYISVRRINRELQIKEQSYVLEEDYEIIIFLDLLEAKKVYNSLTGKEYLSLFWKDMVGQGNKNYLLDVTRQIIPWLIEKKVNVVIANGVNTQASQNRYINKAIEESNIRDNGRKYGPLKERYLSNGKWLGDEKLGEALLHTKQDFSKGYLRRFHTGDSYNFADGFRMVQYLTESKNKNSIYFFGSCITCSAWTRDEDTFCNHIAKAVYKNYNVFSRTNNIENMNLVMRECVFKENDIVVLFFDELIHYKKHKDIYIFDLDRCLRSIPDLGKHMLDGMWQHLDKVALKVLAETMLKFFEEHNLLSKGIKEDKCGSMQNYMISHSRKRPRGPKMYEDRNFKKWLEGVPQFKKKSGEVNGAIVMNCNPMTLGHLYLIQQARKYVDNLYVFIVEEDSSEFAFEDRINIVRNNLADMENVIILPSGKYVLSAGTLEGYFSKKDFMGTTINASEDLELFLTIAQYMNITYRFVGSEPKDKFTRLYNEAMKKKLPDYGISVVEIERMQISGQIVSASMVRNYMSEKNWDAIKKIVPSYTYQYLCDKFG